MDNLIKIAPSILAADLGNLSLEAKRAEDAGADMLHLDIMDGHFVPNISFGPMVVEAIKKVVSIPLDVHLMLTHPHKYIDNFINAGADYLTVHAEADHNLKETIQTIQAKGIKSGPVLNPDKGIELIKEVLPFSDMVLIMSVFPGFGGQKFITDVLSKVKELKQIKEDQKFTYLVEIDGGINEDSVKEAIIAGIDVAVAGTALYHRKDMKEAIKQMRCG